MYDKVQIKVQSAPKANITLSKQLAENLNLTKGADM